MSNLSDSSNFGAEQDGNPRYYTGTARGSGRWALIPNLGLLWTDDDTALQLESTPNTDRAAAHAFRKGLHALAAQTISATTAFDRVVEQYAATVIAGDLADLPA